MVFFLGEGGMVFFLGEGGDCGEFYFFTFLLLIFVNLQFLPNFLFFRKKNKLIKLGIFLLVKNAITNFINPLNI